jgi:hypothetical protein
MVGEDVWFWVTGAVDHLGRVYRVQRRADAVGRSKPPGARVAGWPHSAPARRAVELAPWE